MVKNKQVFIVLLSFGRSLATKCLSLINEPFMARSSIIVLNYIEAYYYPFMISLDKCYGSGTGVDDLSAKIWVPMKTKDVNFKVFNMITTINEAKPLMKHISCDCKC